MTPAEVLLAYGLRWLELANGASALSREMGAAGLPIERCVQAARIATLALELALQLEDLARHAAPMPRRD